MNERDKRRLNRQIARVCDMSHDVPAEHRAVMLGQVFQSFPLEPEAIGEAVAAAATPLIEAAQDTPRLRARLEQIEEAMEAFASLPWRPGVVIERQDTPSEPRVLVSSGESSRALVRLAPEVEIDELRPGRRVFLSNDRNIVLGIDSGDSGCAGEIAQFERWLSSGRIVLKSRDDEFVVDVSEELIQANPKPGDSVLWDRGWGLATEHFERVPTTSYFEEAPAGMGPHSIGGHGRIVRKLLGKIRRSLTRPDLLEAYKTEPTFMVLLTGPPGNGKTLLARIIASQVGRFIDGVCKLVVVQPGAFEDQWVGATQRKIRETFAAVREAAQHGPVVVFLDEVDASAARRGSGYQLQDKFLNALLAELSGFEKLSNCIFVAATNRPDILSRAFVDRMNAVIKIPSPDADGAREIFGVLFNPATRIAPGVNREELIDRAVTRLYAPNADNKVCMLRMRDGAAREIRAGDIMSGRTIGHIVGHTIETAIEREDEATADGEGKGIRSTRPVAVDGHGVNATDIDTAVEAELERMRESISVGNARSLVSDLPDDVDVVAVERVERSAKRSFRVLRAV